MGLLLFIITDKVMTRRGGEGGAGEVDRGEGREEERV
jgi:hypothetical protein